MLGIILILIAAVFAVRIAYGIGRETAMTHIHFEKQKSFDEGFEIGHKKGYELGEKKGQTIGFEDGKRYGAATQFNQKQLESMGYHFDKVKFP